MIVLEKPVLTDISRTEIQSAINKYFEMKDGVFHFTKKCYLVIKKKNCVLKRIQEFVEKIAIILNVPNIPENFKLNQVDPRVTTESIKSAVDFVTKDSPTNNENTDVKALVSMCTTSTQQVSDAQEAERERNADAGVRTGGRRSRYRHRPTKKYFKSRRHSSHKKKRHHRTKRHTKRHRKTKRHIKRY